MPLHDFKETLGWPKRPHCLTILTFKLVNIYIWQKLQLLGTITIMLIIIFFLTREWLPEGGRGGLQRHSRHHYWWPRLPSLDRVPVPSPTCKLLQKPHWPHKCLVLHCWRTEMGRMQCSCLSGHRSCNNCVTTSCRIRYQLCCENNGIYFSVINPSNDSANGNGAARRKSLKNRRKTFVSIFTNVAKFCAHSLLGHAHFLVVDKTAYT